MKVIFLEDVPGTGDAGEVKEVKNGFARNFLLPRKLATPATKNNLQRGNIIEKGAQQKRLKLSDDARVVAGALDGMAITIEVRVGPTGRLFGAVTGRHIADEVNKLTDRDLDHRSILLGDAIHDPGDYDVTVRLYRDVTAKIKVSVVPEGYLQEQAKKAAEVTATGEGTPESAAAEASMDEDGVAESGSHDEEAEAEQS
jgi:large subunit ribosomal protein L9